MEVAVGALLTPVMTAYRTRFVLSPQVLWGNVASALAGAAGMIADAYPAAGDRAGAVVARMLELPPLAGTGALVRPDPAHPRRFLVRRNCCLYYRIPGGGTCGDCVLTRDTDRRRHWREVLTR
ncbi:(2Fe-2S)-binding protein [Planosporangium flavigriseum]|nr:(2Fe-2S)-binding protein [Planosporangium flavigriseum]NJC66215.1 (2Fe-2S)-binding protein [Planosporangium flavigriseum]